MSKTTAIGAYRLRAHPYIWLIRVELTELHFQIRWPFISRRRTTQDYLGQMREDAAGVEWGMEWRRRGLGVPDVALNPFLSDVLAKVLESQDDPDLHPDVVTCTGLAARWCPLCGDCECWEPPSDVRPAEGWNGDCPLHGLSSRHPNRVTFPPYGEVVL